MAASDRTKKLRACYWTTKAISILLTVVPLAVFVIMAFVEGDARQKLTLGCMASVAILFTLMNVLLKYDIRSTTWILLIGIYACLQDIMPLILALAACTIADEFVVSPLCKGFKAKLSINKEIDRRDG